MAECGKIIEKMNELAPESLAFGWDNVGLMVGDRKKEIKKILFALDCYEEVIDEAIQHNADMIVTHHPFIFGKIKNLDYDLPLTKKIVKAIKNDIAVYSAHTNLDIAKGGTNSVLFERLSLQREEPFAISEGSEIGKVGFLKEEVTFKDFIDFVKKELKAEYVTVNGEMNKKIYKIALCTGSGGEFISEAINKGCDCYITGDIKYHDAQKAFENGLCLIDATHYLTEVIVLDCLCEYIRKSFSDVECVISRFNGQTLHIM